jgi:anhydro-N-acetylmuramic acid kinase
MSGTSADGIDVALCEVNGAPPRLQARVLHAVTVPYNHAMRQRILAMCQLSTSNVRELCVLNFDLAKEFASAVLNLLAAHGVPPHEVDLIASHGQTLWHEVQGMRVHSTLQIGEAAVLAERTGITTISNFRARDVAAGGQGAPLTAYVDWLLLRHEAHWRAIQNIGGMANVSFLPPLTHQDAQLLAFDTGAGNALIDIAVYRMTNGELRYDPDGTIARQGVVDEAWLADLMKHPYYQRQPPKTTGREIFGTQAALELVQDGQRRGLTMTQIVATLTALTAWSIADAYQRFAPEPPKEVILGGGGKNNQTLVAMLRSFINADIITHEDIGINSNYKEALVFAVLAHETWHGRTATLASQTGARHASVLGQITPGANMAALRQAAQ